MAIIKTARLLLRPIERSDAPRFAELCNDLDIARNTARIPHPYTLADAEAFVDFVVAAFEDGKEYTFAACLSGDTAACAGAMEADDKTFEIGYWVGALFCGRGIATEAARAVTRFTFDSLGAETVTAGFFRDNPASGRVLEKISFLRTGETVNTTSIGRGEEVETIKLSLHAIDFRRLEAAGTP